MEAELKMKSRTFFQQFLISMRTGKSREAVMHKRWLFILLLLLAACDMLGSSPAPTQPPGTVIQSVEVSPQIGSGSFTLEVNYIPSAASSDDTIRCNYVSPSSASVPIDSIFFLAANRDIGVVQTGTLTFSVSESGDYTAKCTADSSGSEASFSFTVSNYPMTINSSGTVTWETPYPATKCVAESQLTLIILADGNAQLLFTAPHRNSEGLCPAETDTWFANGQANFDLRTVTFTSGSGSETASGTISYIESKLVGTVEYLAGSFKYTLVLGGTP